MNANDSAKLTGQIIGIVVARASQQRLSPIVTAHEHDTGFRCISRSIRVIHAIEKSEQIFTT